MGSSVHKNRKSSSKARRRDRCAKKKKRSLEFSSLSSDDYSSSSSGSEGDYRDRRTHSRRTKKRSRHSPTRDGRKSHQKRSRSQRHSQPMEKKKPTKKKQRNSRKSCSTCSNRSRSRSRSRSSNRDNVYNRSKEPDRSYHRDEKRRRRSRYQPPSFHTSRTPSRNRCASSCERPTNFVSSVVTVTKELEEVGRIESVKEETKAEIMQSYDDYPSPRSNESYEGGTKGKIEVAEPSAKLVETSKGERSADNGISNSDDLESQLRQKALENFAKFRFRVLANAKSVGNEKDETVSESVRTVSYNSTAKLMYKITETNSMSVDTKKLCDTSIDHSVVMATDAKQGLTLPESGDGKLLEPIAVTKNIPRQKVIETSKSRPGISCMSDHKIDEPAPGVSYSCPDPEKEAHDASHEVKDDNKSGSQLQEKTMSVMRGGELVQVSYKVYIPQKSRALARRQLQR